MRELTMNEVQDVNGGYGTLIRGLIVGWRLIRNSANDEDVNGNSMGEGEMPDYNDRNG
jgi:hypothetical protein